MMEVTFTGGEHTNWGGCADPTGVLVIGQEYEVESINCRSWHTRVHLKGIEGYFGSSVFDGVPEIVFSERGVWKPTNDGWVNEGLMQDQARS